MPLHARYQNLVLTGLILILLATRLIGLGILPDTLNPDEADNIQSALRVLNGSPPENGFFGYDWYGEPAFTAYVFALFIKLFGVSQLAARLPTALASVASLAVFFEVVRRQVRLLAAILATLLFGCQLWFLHLSRMAWNNVHVTLFTLLAVLSLLNALRAPRTPRGRAWFALCGVCCALTLYGYPAGRVLVASLFLVLPLALYRSPSSRKDLVWGYVSIGCIAAVLFLPEAVYVAQNWQPFLLRLTSVSILNKPAFEANPIGTLGTQLEANGLGFWIGRFNNIPSHFPPGEPLLDRLTGVLVACGATASLVIRRFRRQFETWLWWSILLVGWCSTEVLTERTPDGARGTGWMPALFVFGALSIDLGLSLASRLPFTARTALAAAIAVFSVAAASADVIHYVDWSRLPATRQARLPYVALDEFPAWSEAVIQQAEQHQAGFNVDQWRQAHPLDGSASSAEIPNPPVALPVTPRAQWLSPVAAIGVEGAGPLVEPRAIAVDSDSNVYVVDADPNVQSVKKFDRNGHFSLAWGQPGTGEGQFTGAWAIVVDARDRVLVLDEETSWVQVFDRAGRFLTRWAGPSSRLYHPRAMALASDGGVLIADTGRGRIVHFSSDGEMLAEYGRSDGDQRLAEPGGVAGLPDGSLVAADSAHGLLRKYATHLRSVAVWTFGSTTALDGPRLAPMPDASLYVTLPEACGIVHLDAMGNVLDTSGNCQTKDYLSFPSAIAVGPSGMVYVADLNRHLVQVLGHS